MKLAFVTRYDAKNIRKWSGTPYNMATHFEKTGTPVEYIGPLEKNIPLSFKLKHKWDKLRGAFRTKSTYLPSVLHGYAKQVDHKLQKESVDAIISPVMETIAYTENDIPSFVWTDAVFASLSAFYPNYFDLSRDTIESGNNMARNCLERTKLAFFSSEWARDSAHSFYGVDKNKLRVVPFGANLDVNYTQDDIRKMIKQRGTKTVKLLFIGVEWHRKGADIALAIAKGLHESGQTIELNIVGVKPPADINIPPYVKLLGFISKHNEEGRAQLERLLRESHFLCVPSRAEAYGIVFCEANAFGVPAIGSCVGGIPTIIRNGVNGFAMPLLSPIDRYCAIISNLMANSGEYETLALSSFQEYETRLNWRVATKTVLTMMQEVL